MGRAARFDNPPAAGTRGGRRAGADLPTKAVIYLVRNPLNQREARPGWSPNQTEATSGAAMFWK